jgi:hypothetical protein
MWRNFLTPTFAVEFLVIIVVWWGVYLLVKKWWTAPTYTVKSDYLRVPTNNALVVLGLLLPILTALAAYLYMNAPQSSYSSLLASIVVMFLVLVVAMWETHSLIGMGGTDDTIVININHDRNLVVGLGLIFALLLLGLLYFAIFFLFELTPLPGPAAKPGDDGRTAYFLSVRKAYLDQTREQVIQSWGKPNSTNADNTKFEYFFDGSTIHLHFDANGRLQAINETRNK